MTRVQRPQPKPTHQPVSAGDRVLAMPTRFSVTAAVVVSVEWNPKPNKPMSWERDQQWRVVVQFFDGTQRRGGWNHDWITLHDETHWVMGCRLGDRDIAERVAYYEMWQAIEDSLTTATDS
ncbi:hypothetical protein ACWDFH_26235 [Streptomyces kronopolitis]